MPFGALANLGVGIAGLAGAFDPKKPPDRSLTQEVQDYIKTLPLLLSAQQQYNPQFAALANQLQESSLFGTPAGSRDEQYIDYSSQPGPEITLPFNAKAPTGYTFVRTTGGPGRGQAKVWRGPDISLPTTKTRNVPTAAVPGQLDLYSRALPQLSDLYNRTQQAQLGSAVQAYGLYGPQVKAAFGNTYPEYNKLLESLLGSAQQDVDNGYNLSPQEQRQVQQASRSAFSARGLGNSPGAANAEALNSVLAGEARRSQRLEEASRLSGLYGASVPSLSLPQISAPLAASPAAAGLLSGSTGPTAYAAQQFGTPFNSYSSNLYDTNLGLNWDYNKTIANIRAQAANQTAQGGAGLLGAAVGGGFGGGLGAAAGSWKGNPYGGSNNPAQDFYSMYGGGF